MNRKHALTLGAVGLSIALAAPPAFGQQAAPGNMNVLIVCGTKTATTPNARASTTARSSSICVSTWDTT